MPPNRYQVRVEGVTLSALILRAEVLVDGRLTDGEHLVMEHPELGLLTITEDCILEIRDTHIPVLERRTLPNLGWERIGIKAFIAKLRNENIVK